MLLPCRWPPSLTCALYSSPPTVPCKSNTLTKGLSTPSRQRTGSGGFWWLLTHMQLNPTGIDPLPKLKQDIREAILSGDSSRWLTSGRPFQVKSSGPAGIVQMRCHLRMMQVLSIRPCFRCSVNEALLGFRSRSGLSQVETQQQALNAPSMMSSRMISRARQYKRDCDLASPIRSFIVYHHCCHSAPRVKPTLRGLLVPRRLSTAEGSELNGTRTYENDFSRINDGH